MTIDLNEARKNAAVATLVGRNGKLSLVVLDRMVPGKSRYHAVKEFNGVFNATMLNAAAEVVKNAIGGSQPLVLHTVDTVAAMYRYYRKLVKDGFDVDELVETVINGEYYTVNEDDTEDIVNAKGENKTAAENFLRVMAEADAKGIFIDIQKASEFNQLTLAVPEGVELSQGQILNFINGTSEEGVTVNGWSTFNRKKAVVFERNSLRGGREFFIYRKAQSRLSNMEKGIMAVLRAQWQECPAAEIAADLEAANDGDMF